MADDRVDTTSFRVAPGATVDLRTRDPRDTGEFDGGKDEAFALMNALELVDISNNLGDSKSLTTHPATTTHRRLTPEARAAVGITDGTIRLSVGLEDPADLIDDLSAALDALG